MSFSDYKHISQVQQEYGIKYEEGNLIQSNPVEPRPTFVEDFQFDIENLDVFASEAARCEVIIFPVLKEVYKKYAAQLALWIQKPMSYNDELQGTPDYMISKKSPLGKTVLETPLLVIVEAKKNDFEQGWGQCLAELVAAQKLNQQENLPIYGIVTDGKHWEFGQLQNQLFQKNSTTLGIDHLSQLLGSLDFVLQSAAENLKKILPM